jgi:predicted transcriptional regulator
MRTVTVCVESLDAGLNRFKHAWETGEYQGEFVTFESVEGMHRMLTPNRWELLRVLQAEGPMGIRELARRLSRDVKNVHTDVTKLREYWLVEDAEDGGIWVPYDEIRAEFVVKRKAV